MIKKGVYQTRCKAGTGTVHVPRDIPVREFAQALSTLVKEVNKNAA